MDETSSSVPASPTPDVFPELAPLAGSSSWQIILLLLAALFLFTRMLRGMQLGGPRQLVGLLALIAAYVTGWIAGPALLPLFRNILSFPDFVVLAICSAGSGLLVYIFIEVLGLIYCKKPEEVEPKSKRRAYATSGLLLGLVNGSIVLLIAMVGLNLLGTIANTQLYSQLIQFHNNMATNPPQVTTTGPATENDGKEGPLYVEKTLGNPAAVFLARLKNSMVLGNGQEIVNKVDPVPNEIYSILQKTIKVLGDPASSERLFQHPDINRLMQHQLIAQLAQDPTIRQLAENRDMVNLMRHPKIVAAANDPEVQKDFSTINFEGALDYALVDFKDTLRGDMESGRVTIQNMQPK